MKIERNRRDAMKLRHSCYLKPPELPVENIGPGFVIASAAKQSQRQRWLVLLITQEIAAVAALLRNDVSWLFSFLYILRIRSGAHNDRLCRFSTKAAGADSIFSQ